MTVRPFVAADREMLHGWREAHAHCFVREAVYPPLGIVVCDDHGPAAALWALEPAGFPYAYLESPVSRPGLSLKEATAAFRFGVECIMQLAGKMWDPPGTYMAFRCSTPPAIARVLRSFGWVREGDSLLVPMVFVRPDQGM